MQEQEAKRMRKKPSSVAVSEPVPLGFFLCSLYLPAQMPPAANMRPSASSHDKPLSMVGMANPHLFGLQPGKLSVFERSSAALHQAYCLRVRATCARTLQNPLPVLSSSGDVTKQASVDWSQATGNLEDAKLAAQVSTLTRARTRAGQSNHNSEAAAAGWSANANRVYPARCLS